MSTDNTTVITSAARRVQDILRYHISKARVRDAIARRLTEGIGKPDFIGDPDKSTSFAVLEYISNSVEQHERSKPSGEAGEAGKALVEIVQVESTEVIDVPLRSVTALHVSRGLYVGNLGRLLTTIREPTGSIVELSLQDQIRLVRSEVRRQLGLMDGDRYRFVKEAWSGRLIALNTGAARRFCLLRRWRPDETLPGIVKTWQFNSDALNLLTSAYWVFLVPVHVGRVLHDDLVSCGVHDLAYMGTTSFAEYDGHPYDIMCCPRKSPWYLMLRNALSDHLCPHFDLSQWLRMLAAGRAEP